MHPLLKKFNILKQKIRLEAGKKELGKKELIKERLIQYMDTPTEAKSAGEHFHPTEEPTGVLNFFYKPMPVFALVVIVALVGGGAVSFAAQGALPGAALYPIKVDFNEKVGAALQFSSEQKANYQADLAARRLEEATELASRGDGSITDTEKADIESRFQAHADKVESRIQDIEAGGDVRAAADVASRFEASLNAQEKILGKLESKNSEVKDINAGVHSTLGSIMGVRVGLESRVAATSTAELGMKGPEAKTAAEGKVNAATNVIASVRSYILGKKEKLGVSAAADAEAKLGAAENLVVQARAKIDAGAYGEAFNLGNEAIRIAQEARALEKANINLNLNMKIGDDGAESEGGMNATGSDGNERDNSTSSGHEEVEVKGGLKVNIGL